MKATKNENSDTLKYNQNIYSVCSYHVEKQRPNSYMCVAEWRYDHGPCALAAYVYVLQ